MRRGCGGCGSCLLWFVIAVLLVDGWVGSSWPLRAVELLMAAALVGAIAYRAAPSVRVWRRRAALASPYYQPQQEGEHGRGR